MRFGHDPDNVDVCTNCGEHESKHEYHCSKCGMQATEIGTCGCGEVHMPKWPCECKASMGLWCPAEKRKITAAQYDESKTVGKLADSLNPEIRAGWTWSDAEVERLWREQAS